MGIPFSYYHLGIPLAIVLNIVIALVTCYSCTLYMETRDMTGRLDSLSEIGYKVMGRTSIYLTSGNLLITSFLVIVIYFMIFGDIASSLIRDTFPGVPKFLGSKEFYVLLIAVVNIPFVVMRAIKELHIAANMLFAAVFLFILLLSIQLIRAGEYMNKDADHSIYYKVKFDLDLITSISIVLVGYGF